MDWYYAIDNQQAGPVSAKRLVELSRDGTLSGETLVWKTGLGNWTAFDVLSDDVYTEAEAEVDPLGEPGAEDSQSIVDTAPCAFSGRIMPVSEMLPYGRQWIAPEFKDVFVQKVLEAGGAAVSEINEYGLQFVGFWWRTLGEIINVFILLIPLAILTGVFMLLGLSFDETADPGAAASILMGLFFLLAMVLMIVLPGFYYTWMIGKYQATIGHMAIGSKVVNPDGTQFGFGKSFARFLCHSMLNGTISNVVSYGFFMVLFLVIIAIVAVFENEDSVMMVMVLPFVLIVGSVVGMILGLFPFWMAGFDPEKRTLHDRICATRVVRK